MQKITDIRAPRGRITLGNHSYEVSDSLTPIEILSSLSKLVVVGADSIDFYAQNDPKTYKFLCSIDVTFQFYKRVMDAVTDYVYILRNGCLNHYCYDPIKMRAILDMIYDTMPTATIGRILPDLDVAQIQALQFKRSFVKRGEK